MYADSHAVISHNKTSWRDSIVGFVAVKVEEIIHVHDRGVEGGLELASRLEYTLTKKKPKDEM